MKKISVIIVTYNSEKHIYDCLASLFKYNDIGDELEVIVVDNCSRCYVEMKTEITKTYGDKVQVFANNKNGGYGQGNNVGIKMAESPIIMVMNPDVRLCEPVFKMVYNAFMSDPKIVMFGFTQRNVNGNIGRSVSWTSRVHPYVAEPLRYLLGKKNIYWQKYMFICGACFFVRKSSFEEVGLYDENIFMFNEEDDIHGRLLKIKGARIVYDKNISYLHLHPAVKDYKKEKYDWLKKSLSSLIYMNERDGISRKKTIDWSIKRTNISVWSEQLKCAIGKGNKDRLNYYEGWRTYLKQQINNH